MPQIMPPKFLRHTGRSFKELGWEGVNLIPRAEDRDQAFVNTVLNLQFL